MSGDMSLGTSGGGPKLSLVLPPFFLPRSFSLILAGDVDAEGQPRSHRWLTMILYRQEKCC